MEAATVARVAARIVSRWVDIHWLEYKRKAVIASMDLGENDRANGSGLEYGVRKDEPGRT